MISILKNLLGKKQEALIDFSQIAVDMHSHLIPGIDDGSKSVKDSLAMINGFIDLGYLKLLPHPML